MLIYLTKMHWPRLRLHKLKRKLEKSSEKQQSSSEKLNSEKSKLEQIKGMLFSLQMVSHDKNDKNVGMLDRILEEIGDGVFLKHHESVSSSEIKTGSNDENGRMPHPRTYSDLITIREEKDELRESVMSKSVHGGMTQASVGENETDSVNFRLVRKKSVRFSVGCNDEDGKYQRSMSLGITRQISEQE